MKSGYKPAMRAVMLCASLFASSYHTRAIPLPANDSTTLLHAFQRGTIEGNFRYYFMRTVNDGDLSDYFANAAGGKLVYKTAVFHGFQLGVGGSYRYNIHSSDLTQPDAITKSRNRYEMTLFDVENPSTKTDLGLLEALFLKYRYRTFEITVGKQSLNTPFINRQDNRMNPDAEEGIYFSYSLPGKIHAEGGWLWGIAPRGTSHWYSFGESVGLYPQGVKADGSKANYFNNVRSKGVGILNLGFRIQRDFNMQLWEYFAENMFNTLMLQGNYVHVLNDHSKMVAALQLVNQQVINDGGNPDQSKTYFRENNKPFVISTRVGWQNKNWQTSVNYTHISQTGQFIFPREWGTEPFFTFVSRERHEGYGGLDAFSVKTAYSFPETGLKTELSLAHVNMPDVHNYALNKYGLPSYLQADLDIRYSFSKALKGLSAQVLIVYKKNRGETYNDPKYLINKVNMFQFNTILNYSF